jgi:hypothetical protein
MDCPDCRAPTVAFEVPEQFREHAPESSAHAALCQECLTLSAAESAPADPPFDRVGEAFPTDEAAVPMALAVGLLDSLALNRAAIEALLEATVEAGTDPLLVLDRLAAQGGVDPVFDLDRRRHQVEQLFG